VVVDVDLAAVGDGLAAVPSASAVL